MRMLLCMILVLALAACTAGEPFDYTEVDELPDEPGLFTGEDGEYVIDGR
ncbi:MAG: hypothetical protein ACFB6S_18150 [Geminicoccaceae bacterium]